MRFDKLNANGMNRIFPKWRNVMDLTLGNDHFLSKINPAATVDQRDAEILALKVAQEPALDIARKEAARRFRIILGHTVPEGVWEGFDEMLEEWAFNYI